MCLRLGPSKSSIPSFFVFSLSPSLLSPPFRGFLFFFSFFPFSCFSVFLPFSFNPHFLFLCNPNPRIQDAATEVKAACHDATLSLPPPRSPYSSSGSSFPSLPLFFTFFFIFLHSTYNWYFQLNSPQYLSFYILYYCVLFNFLLMINYQFSLC